MKLEPTKIDLLILGVTFFGGLALACAGMVYLLVFTITWPANGIIGGLATMLIGVLYVNIRNQR